MSSSAAAIGSPAVPASSVVSRQYSIRMCSGFILGL